VFSLLTRLRIHPSFSRLVSQARPDSYAQYAIRKRVGAWDEDAHPNNPANAGAGAGAGAVAGAGAGAGGSSIAAASAAASSSGGGGGGKTYNVDRPPLLVVNFMFPHKDFSNYTAYWEPEFANPQHAARLAAAPGGSSHSSSSGGNGGNGGVLSHAEAMARGKCIAAPWSYEEYRAQTFAHGGANPNAQGDENDPSMHPLLQQWSTEFKVRPVPVGAS
jgi:hypothetical protein